MNDRILSSIPPLPPGTPKRVRVSLVAIKFLQYHNRRDGLMSFAGVWWGMWTVVFPNFWYGWPVTEQLSRMTGGFPQIISWLLLLSGFISYFGAKYGLKRLLVLCSMISFVCWSMLTTAFAVVQPIFSPAVACYSLFAIAMLLSYVNHVIRIEDHQLPDPKVGDVDD